MLRRVFGMVVCSAFVLVVLTHIGAIKWTEVEVAVVATVDPNVTAPAEDDVDAKFDAMVGDNIAHYDDFVVVADGMAFEVIIRPSALQRDDVRLKMLMKHIQACGYPVLANKRQSL